MQLTKNIKNLLEAKIKMFAESQVKRLHKYDLGQLKTLFEMSVPCTYPRK